MEYLRLSWADIEDACRKISVEIASRGIGDYMLIGISRGGLVPLRMLSDFISAQELSTLQVRFYEDIGKTRGEPEVVLPVQGDVSGRNVILVDDISDTGESIIAAREHLKKKGAMDIVVATVSMKTHTKLVPDIYAFETTAWVIFPWEVQETIRRIIEAAGERALAVKELRKAGLQPREYVKLLSSIMEGERV